MHASEHFKHSELVKELLDVRDRISDIHIFSKAEINDLLNYACIYQIHYLCALYAHTYCNVYCEINVIYTT